MPETPDGSAVPAGEPAEPPTSAMTPPASAAQGPEAAAPAPAGPDPADPAQYAEAPTAAMTAAQFPPPGDAEPAPGETSEPLPTGQPWAYPPPPPPPLAKSRRGLAIVLGIVGLVVLIVGAAVAVALTRPGGGDGGGDTATLVEPSASETAPWSGPLLADEIFPEELVLLERWSGDDLDFELKGDWTHTGDCAEAGRNKTTVKFLADCEARIEGVYDSKGDDYRVAYQVFAFPRDEMLNWDSLGKLPKDFDVDWKAKARMPDGFWWNLNLAGPFLVLTHAGPERWNEDSEKKTEELVQTASDAIVETVKDVLYW